MELKQFISSTLTEILQGVSDAQNKIKGDSSSTYICPVSESYNLKSEKLLGYITGLDNPIYPVEFDIAIVATDEGNAGGGIKVLGTGADAKLAYSNTESSRIKFIVPIAFPTQPRNK